VLGAATLAAKAAAAARAQHTTLPGQQMPARLVAQPAEG
jgi:hypothetical protein